MPTGKQSARQNGAAHRERTRAQPAAARAVLQPRARLTRSSAHRLQHPTHRRRCLQQRLHRGMRRRARSRPRPPPHPRVQQQRLATRPAVRAGGAQVSRPHRLADLATKRPHNPPPVQEPPTSTRNVRTHPVPSPPFAGRRGRRRRRRDAEKEEEKAAATPAKEARLARSFPGVSTRVSDCPAACRCRAAVLPCCRAAVLPCDAGVHAAVRCWPSCCCAMLASAQRSLSSRTLGTHPFSRLNRLAWRCRSSATPRTPRTPILRS